MYQIRWFSRPGDLLDRSRNQLILDAHPLWGIVLETILDQPRQVRR
jgi:hypothetical protein